MEDSDRTHRTLHEYVEAFEHALRAGRRTVEPWVPHALLIALDGSNQDPTALRFATDLAKCVSTCAVLVTSGAGPDGETMVANAVVALAANGVTARGVVASGEDIHERILRVAAAERCDCLALPCPYGHDYAEVGDSSLGTVVELVLVRAELPVLVVRADRAALPAPHVVVTSGGAADAIALSLGFGLAAALRSDLQVSWLRKEDTEAPPDELARFGAPLPDLLPYLPGEAAALAHRVAPRRELASRLIVAPRPEPNPRLHLIGQQRDGPGVSPLVHDFVLASADPVVVVPERVSARAGRE